MSVVLITGSSGLIGSEAARFFHGQGFTVVGIDNNMRQYFFGQGASTEWNTRALRSELPKFRHHDFDIRDSDRVNGLFRKMAADIVCIVHAAAQPSHDWAAREPVTDFTINANGTLNLLEATRRFSPGAVFIFTSTNKVYGDLPNQLPFRELPTRWEVGEAHRFHRFGIDESMSVDASLHSLFGASKAAADILVQEYGRYFGLKTVCFRGGCLTGPAHSAAQLHGFLAYLVLCAVQAKPYTIFGYKGKQVRDNIHSRDLVSAFWEFFLAPRSGEIYNIGGSRHSNVSILEAIQLIENLSGREVQYSVSDAPRSGDHVWYVSDVRKFQSHYPKWQYRYDMQSILAEMLQVAETRAQ